MKNPLKIYFLALLLIGNNLKSQNITAPTKNIDALLCKRWIIDYALMGDTKMDAPPDQKDIYYDFKKDKTFTMTMGGTKKPYTGAGTWRYDAAKKVIMLTIHGSVALIVNSLTETELIMTTDLKSGTSGDKLRIAYKVKTT